MNSRWKWQWVAPLALTSILVSACSGGSSGTNAGAGEQSAAATEDSASSAPASAASSAASGAAANGNADSQISGTVTIEGGAQLISAAEYVLKGFQQAHPDVKLVFNKYPYNEYPQKMKLQLSGKSPTPDVLLLHSEFIVPFVRAGWFADLTDKVNQSDFLDGIFHTVTWNDKVYGIPNQGSFSTFIYRKDLFDQLGIQPPTTFDEYMAAGAKLKAAGHYIGAIAPTSPAGTFEMFLYQSGGAIFDGQGNVILDTPQGKGVEALNRIKQVYDAGYLDSVDAIGQAAYFDDLSSGKIAADAEPSFYTAYFHNSLDPKSQGYGHFQAAAMPKLADDGPYAWSQSPEYYTINKNSKNPDAAWAVIQYLTMNQDAAKAFIDLDQDGLHVRMITNYKPSLQAIAQSGSSKPWPAYAGQDVGKFLADTEVNHSQDIRVIYEDSRTPQVGTIEGNEVGKFLQGKASAEQTIANIVKQVKQLKP